MNNELVISLILYAFICLLIPILFYFTKYLGPTSNSKIKNKAYESGITTPYGNVNSSFNVKYYLVGIIFVIFDIEIIFMYPWALSLRDLGSFGLLEMFVFMAILILGLIYVYAQRILRWA